MKSPRNSVRKKTGNKIETMSKRRKQAKRPSGRDLARAFLAAIAWGKEFESMKQQEERNRTDE